MNKRGKTKIVLGAVLLCVLLASIVFVMSDAVGDSVNLDLSISGDNLMIAYVVKNSHYVDENFVGILENDDANQVNIIEDKEIPMTDFSEYDLIFIGKGKIRNINSINMNKPIISINSFHGRDLGFTDRDGVSRYVSNSVLKILKGEEEFKIYNKPSRMLGVVGVSAYYLANNNVMDGVIGVAKISDEMINPGSVIAYKDNSNSNRCFFGIVETKYWTEDAGVLFEECFNHVMGNVPEEEPECVINDDCSTGFECVESMCVEIENGTGMNQTQIHDVKIDESLTNAVNGIRIKNESGEFLLNEISELKCGKYTISYRTLNVGNFTENVNFFGNLGNFNWSSLKENLSSGGSTTTGSKTITIDNSTFELGNYNLTIRATIVGAEDAVPQDNIKMREVNVICNQIGNNTEEPECVINDDCSTGFECVESMCVEVNNNPSSGWLCEDDGLIRDDCLSFSSGKMTRCYLNTEKTSWDFCSSGWKVVES